MALLDHNGLIDKLSCLLLFIFPGCFYLTHALQIKSMDPIFDNLITTFGLTPAKGVTPPYRHDFISMAGGSWALPLSMMGALGLFLKNASRDVRELRQFLALCHWIGWFVAHGKFALDGGAGGIQAPFNYVWITMYAFMAIVHASWVFNGNLARKMKLI